MSYKAKWEFTKYICPRPNHFCSGQHIPDIEKGVDINKEKDIGVCQYLNDRTCCHPKSPYGTLKIGRRYRG
jgi:hypothetical protein